MGTRVRIRGRVVFQRDIRPQESCPPELDEHGQQIFFTPLAQSDKPWPEELVDGAVWICPDTGFQYRVVDESVLRADQGWASVKHWCPALKISLTQFYRLVRKGFFDCAVSEAGGFKKYRCLDYAKTTRWIADRRVGPMVKKPEPDKSKRRKR